MMNEDDRRFPGELEIKLLIKKGNKHHVIARGVDYNFIAQGPDADTAIQCVVGAAVAQALADEENGRPIWAARKRENNQELKAAYDDAGTQYRVIMRRQPFTADANNPGRIPAIKAEIAFDHREEAVAG